MERRVLDALVAFVHVAEAQSFRAAATVLEVSPSAVSQAVKGLEERLGVSLLIRSTRTVRLTDEGARLLADVRGPLEQVDEAVAAARVAADVVTGTLRLSVPRLALPGIVRPALGRFTARYPGASVEVVADDGFADLLEDGIDAGIRLGEQVEAGMVAVPLTPPMRLAVVGSPAYFEEHGRPAHPDDLRHHACINWRNASTGTLYRWEFEEAGREWEVAVRGPITVNDPSVKAAAALDGLGLAYELDPFVENDVAAGRLERVLEPYCPASPGFVLYHPAAPRISPKLRAFIDCAQGAVGG